MKRVIKWAVINGCFGYALYLGFYEGVGGALNVAVFYGWIQCAVGMLALFFSGQMKKGLTKRPTVIEMFDPWFDLAVVVVFVWHGYIVLGLLYGMAQLSISNLYKDAQ